MHQVRVLLGSALSARPVQYSIERIFLAGIAPYFRQLRRATCTLFRPVCGTDEPFLVTKGVGGKHEQNMV